MAVPTYLGALSNGAQTSVAQAWPAGHEVNDVALLFTESTNDEVVTLSTAAGFVELSASPVIAGSGALAGTRLTAFWCRATSNAMTTPVVADAGDHVVTAMIVIRGCESTSDPWDDIQVAAKDPASTSVVWPSVTTAGITRLIALLGTRDNDLATAAFSAYANGALTGILEKQDIGIIGGNGGGIVSVVAEKATAGATGTTSATVTSSINALMTVALKPPTTDGPTLVFVGLALSLGAGGSAIAWPNPHQVGDVLIISLESHGDDVVTLSVPAGFAAVDGSPVSTGTGGAGTRITSFWCRATSTSMSAFTVGTVADHQSGVVTMYRGCAATGNPWDVTAAAVKAAASTTATFEPVTTTVDDCLIVQICSRDNDVGNAAFTGYTNTGMTNLTERFDDGTSGGNGGGLAILTGDKASAGSSGSTTAAVASSINAMLTIALRPEPTSQDEDVTGSASGAGTATGAVVAEQVVTGVAAGAGTSTGVAVPPAIGAGAGAGSASAAVVSESTVVGAAAGAGAGAGVIVQAAVVSGSAAGAGSATGETTQVLAGAATGAGSASASVVQAATVTGSAAGEGVAVGVIEADQEEVVTGAAAGAGAATATVVPAHVLTGVAGGDGAALGVIVQEFAVVGAATGSGTATGVTADPANYRDITLTSRRGPDSWAGSAAPDDWVGASVDSGRSAGAGDDQWHATQPTGGWSARRGA